ncbi:MAG: hypothetical protein A3F09_04055 [Chlamydiae bacterium RIFCSPHIGHO2_12_FULL_49_11]|nr:MAG: hypothetical protein A3F09_04055 [Chlamydiae bacterium RIFCSPHIGHO2_12_FULL_49_11]
MSIAKVIEVISEGGSMEEAMENALREASKTVQNIRQIDVDHVYAVVENNRIVKYRIDTRVSFVVKSKAA